MNFPTKPLAIIIALMVQSTALPVLADNAKTLANDVEAKVIELRRQLHQHPELSNREFETSKLVASELKKLGLEVTTGIAHTGVVAILKGGKSGPLIGLRADMDALPVTEQVDLPFASKAMSKYRGKDVGVMHAVMIRM